MAVVVVVEVGGVVEDVVDAVGGWWDCGGVVCGEGCAAVEEAVEDILDAGLLVVRLDVDGSREVYRRMDSRVGSMLRPEGGTTAPVEQEIPGTLHHAALCFTDASLAGAEQPQAALRHGARSTCRLTTFTFASPRHHGYISTSTSCNL